MNKRIETQADFAEWNKAVNSFQKASGICDLQDVYARSDEKVIKSLFLEQDKFEKELTVFCVKKAMGSDPMFRLMKAWARVQAEKVIRESDADLDKRYDELNEARRAFELERTAIETQNKGYKNEITVLTDTCDHLGDEVKRLRDINNELERRIYDLQEDFDKALADNEVHETFRDYIKGIMQEVVDKV